MKLINILQLLPVTLSGDNTPDHTQQLAVNTLAHSFTRVYAHPPALSGWGSDPLYDGCAVAADGDVVAVTLNYRLGMNTPDHCHGDGLLPWYEAQSHCHVVENPLSVTF